MGDAANLIAAGIVQVQQWATRVSSLQVNLLCTYIIFSREWLPAALVYLLTRGVILVDRLTRNVHLPQS